MESKHRCTHKEINAQQMYNFFALYHSSTYTFILWTLLSSPLPLSLQNRRIAYVVGALYILLLFLNFINYFIWNNWRLKSFIYHSRLQRAKHNFIRLVKRQSRFFFALRSSNIGADFMIQPIYACEIRTMNEESIQRMMEWFSESI